MASTITLPQSSHWRLPSSFRTAGRIAPQPQMPGHISGMVIGLPLVELWFAMTRLGHRLTYHSVTHVLTEPPTYTFRLSPCVA